MMHPLAAMGDERVWRCACAVRPVLGVYTPGVGMHIQIRARSKPRSYAYTPSGLIAHCGVCHTWRICVIAGDAVAEGPYTGPVPDVVCVCVDRALALEIGRDISRGAAEAVRAFRELERAGIKRNRGRRRAS